MADRWDAVAALIDGSRRALYDYVRRQDHAVGRDEAAVGTGMSRGLAAFHLDKLVQSGLLTAHYASPAGQPRGRGRAPKVYRPAGDEVAVTIPERRYELIAQILADAVAGDPAHAREAALRLARQRGTEIGSQVHRTGAALTDILDGLGFEPQPQGTCIVLRNCPFHALAERQRSLVCGMNHQFVAGLLDGLRETTFDSRLEPRPDACCVRLASG